VERKLTDLPALREGDYVLATKYSDGDPGDHYCVGYLQEIMDHFGEARYVVVDNSGVPFRANGFRRAKRISHERGVWLIARFPEIEQGRRSLWGWVRQSMKETV